MVLGVAAVLAFLACGPTRTADVDRSACDEACSDDRGESASPLSGSADLDGCSGSIFRFEGQPLTEPALVLTNGHCVEHFEPEGAISNQWTSARLRVFDDEGGKTEWISAESLLYATMEQTDLAVLRLDATFEDLTERGVRVRVLSPERPSPGLEVQVLAGGVEWVTECTIDRIFPQVREGDFEWHDTISLSDECETFYGTSGAPIVATETDLIVGVNNTGVLEEREPCELDQPCGIDEDGNVEFWVGASFAQQTADLYSCIDDDYEIDLERPGCLLPR